MSEPGSSYLNQNRQQELSHRYYLGLYSVLERLNTDFPDVLFEGCSGGGGRFDPAMLYYFPQNWTSDNTDAIERIYIQYGTSMVYPANSMGAHVAAVPSNQVKRNTPIKLRGDVAMSGQFGYELDLGELTNEEIAEVKKQIKKYKYIREVIQFGDMYRILSPYDGDNAAWSFVSEDKSRAVMFYYVIKPMPSAPKHRVKLLGLNEDFMYRNICDGKVYSGEALLNIGLTFENNREYRSEMIIFEKY